MDTFQFDDILVYRSVYAPVNSNMYTILTTHEAIIFDPCEDEELLRLLKDNEINKVHVFLTHEHYDHTSGLKWLRDHEDYKLYCHVATSERLKSKRGSLPHLVSFVLAQQDKEDGGHRYQDFKKSYLPYTCKADRSFENGDEFEIGQLHFKVTATPGHSRGSACYIMNDKLLFSGDTLLQDDAVILRFPESDEYIYKEVTLPYLQSLDKKLIVMPGHGNPFVLSETKNI